MPGERMSARLQMAAERWTIAGTCFSNGPVRGGSSSIAAARTRASESSRPRKKPMTCTWLCFAAGSTLSASIAWCRTEASGSRVHLSSASMSCSASSAASRMLRSAMIAACRTALFSSDRHLRTVIT
eukprot:7250659-Prymnesium_polylepis.1